MFGYRRLLLGNTIAVSVVLCSFALLTPDTPPWVIVAFVYVYGAVMSLQYTSMNTLAYVDLDVKYASMASSMASTAQYLSMSFGIALASLLMGGFLASHNAQGYVLGLPLVGHRARLDHPRRELDLRPIARHPTGESCGNRLHRGYPQGHRAFLRGFDLERSHA